MNRGASFYYSLLVLAGTTDSPAQRIKGSSELRIADPGYGTIMVTARTPDGHTHVVTGDDADWAVCLAAERCGVELENG